MSKELETLGIFTYELSKKYPHDRDLQEYFCKVADLVNKTTPPTADELCEELEKYYGDNVFHNTYEHDDINETFMRDAFYRVKIKIDMDGKPYKVKRDIVAGGSDGITFNAWLPPTLIKRIAQFYESEVKE